MKVLHRTLLVGLLLSMALLVACNGGQSPVKTDDGAVVEDDDLVDRLEASGDTVTTAGTVSQPFFTPEGKIIVVKGQDVQVFEYDSETATNVEASLVSPD